MNSQPLHQVNRNQGRSIGLILGVEGPAGWGLRRSLDDHPKSASFAQKHLQLGKSLDSPDKYPEQRPETGPIDHALGLYHSES